jgi:selenide,water dikinase
LSLPRDKAEEYCRELKTLDGHQAWIIGDVLPGPRAAKMAENLKILDV